MEGTPFSTSAGKTHHIAVSIATVFRQKNSSADAERNSNQAGNTQEHAQSRQ